MAGNSKVAIFTAIGANILIAVSKFIGALITGSSAMVAEGIHSLVDTFNGVLLLYGIKRSKKIPDEKHPFGYGKEVYFWSFIVAMLIFAIGGGFALYEGIYHFRFPRHGEPSIWNYVILGLALIFESGALFFALREFKKTHHGKGFFKSIRESKDAATFAIIIEDSAAVVGLLIALAGITLGTIFNNEYFEAGATVLIGLLLCSVAFFLARESKGLLIGESLDSDELNSIEGILTTIDSVKKFDSPRTMHLSPESVLLAVEIEFDDILTIDQIEEEINKIESEITAAFPHIDKIYIEANELS